MQDPWDNGLGNWKLQKIDDAHFYQMSYPEKVSKPGIVQRMMKVIDRELVILRCRLATFRLSPTLMVEQQCECLES